MSLQFKEFYAVNVHVNDPGTKYGHACPLHVNSLISSWQKQSQNVV